MEHSSEISNTDSSENKPFRFPLPTSIGIDRSLTQPVFSFGPAQSFTSNAPVWGSFTSVQGSSDVKDLFGKPIATDNTFYHVEQEREENRESDAKTCEGDADQQQHGPMKRGSNETPRHLRSASGSDEESKTVVVKGLPDAYLSSSNLREVLSEFGVIDRVFFNRPAHTATVRFHDAESAMRAKALEKLPNGLAVQVFLKLKPPTKAERRLSSTADNEVDKSQITAGKLEEVQAEPDEIDNELLSMRGSSDTENIFASKRKPRASATFTRQTSVKKAIEKVRPRKTSVASKAETVSVRNHAKTVSVVPQKIILSNSVGHTAGERYTILEERDKILRNIRKSSHTENLATAEVIQGTCLDMCPEKERYMREDRRRLSNYEIIPGTDQIQGKNPQVDHRRAVKEYSRSSADQDMPLPSELRPADVLDRTMNYLLNCVVNTGGHGRWEHWFDFLWNRTRGIRKDITQQQLCNPAAVSLVEKCARFHIYCSEALCEEDVTIFEPKINNENLTKCLQTLKEFYSDLLKQHVFCPNEAEFRAYMVLMKLNEGDILREVQQLRAEIRESVEVKFAVKIYSALNSNNYVKFFKLVRSASFLCCCILHRYFSQIRACALQRMIRCYTTPGHGSTPSMMQYSLSEITRLLAFEDDVETRMFCEHHGVVFSADNQSIERARFVNPEMAFAPRCAIRLIHGKQNGLLSEVLNGGPVPADELMEPVSSFDDQGCYIGEADNLGVVQQVDSQNIAEAVSVSSGEGEIHVAQKKPHAVDREGEPVGNQSTATSTGLRVAELIEAVKHVTKDLCHEVINTLCHDISVSVINESRQFYGYVESVYLQMIDDCVRETCQQDLKECAMLAEELRARKRAIMSATCERHSVAFCSEIIENDVSWMCRDIASSAINEARKHEAAVQSTSDAILEDILSPVIANQVQLVAQQFHKTDVLQRLKLLQDCCTKIESRRLRFYFTVWKNIVRVPSLFSWRNQLSRLLPDSTGASVINSTLHVGNTAHVTLKDANTVLESRQQLVNDLIDASVTQTQSVNLAWSSIDIATIVSDCVVQSKQIAAATGCVVPWKCVLFEPLLINETSRHCTKWLKAKFSHGAVPSRQLTSCIELCSLYSTNVKLNTVKVCVTSVPADVNVAQLERQRHLMGTCAVVYVVSCNSLSSAKDWKAESERLKKVLNAKPRLPPIPLAVVCFDVDSNLTATVGNLLDLDELQSSAVVSGCRAFTLSSDVVGRNSSADLNDIVQWLCRQYPSDFPPQLKSLPLSEFIEDSVCAHFTTPALQTVAERRKQGLGHNDCKSVIQWYNCVIRWLADMVTDSRLQQLSWPIIEFCQSCYSEFTADWNRLDSMKSIRDSVLTLQLNEMKQHQLQENIGSWSDAVNDVWLYVSAIDGNSDHNYKSRLTSRIERLIRKTEVEFCKLMKLTTRIDDVVLTYECMPWTNIIIACVEYQLEKFMSNSSRNGYTGIVHFMPQLMIEHPPPNMSLPSLCVDATADMKLADSLLRSAVKRKQQVMQHKALAKCRRNEAGEALLEQFSDDNAEGHEAGARLNRSSLSYRSDSLFYEDTKRTVEQLKRKVSDEFCKSVAFTNYLDSLVNGGGGRSITPRKTVLENDAAGATDMIVLSQDYRPHNNVENRNDLQRTVGTHVTNDNRLDELNNAIQCEKDASRLFEMQLMRLLMPSD